VSLEKEKPVSNAKIVLKAAAAVGLLTLGLLADAKPAAALRNCPPDEKAYCASLPAEPITCTNGTTYYNQCMVHCYRAYLYCPLP
jgi:hypothetical protein